MRPTHTPFIMKTRRYDLTPAVAALILFFGVAAATPASAQDVGNAPFWGTMSVANGGGTIGAAGGTDGVTFYGGSLAGAGGAIWANGQLKAALTTAGGAGTLSVLWDQPGTATAFSNLTTYAIPGNGTHDISIPAPVAQATGAGIWVRFVFTTVGGAIGVSNTAQDGTHTSEISDFQINIVAATALATVNTQTGGVTTSIVRNGSDVEVISNLKSIFRGPAGNSGNLRLEGGNVGNDIFVWDLSAGTPKTAGTLTVDGNGGSDQLVINDGVVTHATVTHTYATSTTGNVTSSEDGTISYESLETATDDNLDAVARVFNFSGSAEIIMLDDSGSDGTIASSVGLQTTFYQDATLTSMTINGNGGNDTVTVRQVSTYAGSIAVNGNAGTDHLTVDFGSGDPVPAGGFTYDGDTGVDADKLSLINGAVFATVTHTGTGEQSGTVNISTQGIISYSNLEAAVSDNLSATTRVFEGDAGDDIATLEDGAGSGDNIGEYDSDNSPVIEFRVTSTDNIIVNLNGGDDQITVGRIDSAWGLVGDNIVINGGAGDDEMVVNFGTPTLVDPIPHNLTGITFNGDADNDNVRFIGAANIDKVTHSGTGANDGTSEFFEPDPTSLGKIAYNSVENPTEDALTDITARDFTLTNAGDTVTLDNNGDGSDTTARYQSNTQPTVLFDITGTTSVTVNGGSANDSITIKELSDTFGGAIVADPNAGSDTLILTFDTGDDPIPTGGLTYDGGVGDTDTIVLNGSAPQTTVTYVDTGDEAGTITNNSGTLTYSNVEGGITDSTPATTRTFDFSQAGASTLEFDDDDQLLTPSNTTDKMVSDVGQDVVYRSPSSTLNIFAGSGANQIIINDLDNNFTGTIIVNGEGDDDTLELDWENNADSPLGGIQTITYDGGGQTSGDDLRLINGSVSYVTHSYTDANSGEVEVAVNTDAMTYTGLEPIVDNLVAVTRTFNFSGVADEIHLDANFSGTTSRIETPSPNLLGAAADGNNTITSEVTTFDDTGTTSVIINGGGGNDVFDVEASDKYTVTANGDAPAVLDGDLFTLNVDALPASAKVTLVESSNTAGTYSFSGTGAGYKDVSYTTMERVTLRYSDPNAFSGDTYEGDWMYPIHTESGISIEPYFNWDIELNQALPGGHPSKFLTLTLDVDNDSDLSSPFFTTTTKEDDLTALIATAANEDHYIVDVDRLKDAIFPLKNNTQYYWGLTGEMSNSRVFCQINRFTTVNNLKPTLDYPSEDLTIYDLDFKFDWNVASPAQPDVYWRMELDNTTANTFVGDVPELLVQGLLLGDNVNDDDTTVADGFADNTEFESTDLPTPLVWGTNYAWRISTMWPVPPTGWVPQEIFDKNETDRLVSLSDVGEFKTVTKALEPNLTYPVGGMSIYANDPVMSWNVAAPFAALTFELEIRSGTNAGPLVCSSPIVGISGLAYDTANCAVPLVPGTTYFWKVRSNDGNVNSGWSAWESFTVLGNGVASAAFPSYPVNGLEIYTTSPEFHWFMAKDPTGLTWVAHYLERISPNPAPASCAALKVAPGAVVAPAAGNVNVRHVDVSGLKPGATYDWCVTTTGANGSVESGLASFSVAGGTVDGAPTATWPIGNPTTYTLDQELHWSVTGAQLGISGYTVEYCVNGPFGSGGPICTTVSGITQRQYEVTGLNYGDVVVWRVKASYINGASDSAWSNGGFTVTGALNTLSAVLTYPVNGLVIYDDQAQFSWYVNGATLPQGTLTFQVQWSYAETFPTIGNVTLTATTTNPYYDVTNLIPGHTYWWRVRISLDGGSTYGGWSSPVGQFATHPGASAVMPRVGSPAQSVVIATNSPTLSWILPTQSTSTLVYEVLIGQREDLADAETFTDIQQTSLRVSDLSSGQYFWAVRSLSSNGTTSARSSVGTFYANGSFSTGVEVEDHAGDNNGGSDNNGDTSDNAGGDVDDNTGDDVSRDQDSSDDGGQSVEDPSEEVLPDNWALGQNYPNPFNPTTTIEFSMPQAAGVTVRVYNVLGQVVKTLVNGTLPPGIHRVQWDATDDTGAGVSSGLYIYRMETEAFQATKTLVLMK